MPRDNLKLADEPIPNTFTFRPDHELNVELREYLIENRISYPELAEAALRDYLSKHPRWPRRSLRLPTGKRPRT